MMKIKSIIPLVFIYFCGVAYAGQGEDIASKLNARNDNVVEKCGENNNPAYECSGVVLHGAGNTDSRFPWAPPTDNSMSYSYIRADVFNRIYSSYDYGIILLPQAEVPADKYKPKYSCSFPINGTTNDREDDGCGEYANDPSSASCQSQGLTNTQKWLDAYSKNAGLAFCGWDLRNGNSDVAFKSMIDVSTILINKGFTSNNEIVLPSWGDEPVKNLPIEAIFSSKQSGASKLNIRRNLLKAQEAQLEYYALVKKWIPIIDMEETKFETNKYKYHFSYQESEQAVPPEGFK
ncbi:hypothetical protein ACG1VR_00835 [Cedecea davisae]|uniref:hypothetical protein n=1 Tax=Cedecea davisae TaxID=158484 RepID=UPI00376F0E4F